MFGKRFTLFKLLGFEVRIDLSWLLIAALVTWSLAAYLFPTFYPELDTTAHWIMGVLGALGLFGSIIVHEFAHSLVARLFGMPMHGITLFIFGGVAEMKDQPPSAKAEFLMSVVGPLTSLVIGGAFWGAGTLGARLPPAAIGVINYVGIINLILAGFNLIPAFPLDGGRLLRSALWAWKKDITWATRVASGFGSAFGIALILLGFFGIFTGQFISGIWWILIGFFVRAAAQNSYRELLFRQGLEGEHVQDFMRRDPVAVNSTLPLDALVHDYFYHYHYRMFPVVDNERLKGCVRSNDLQQVPKPDWSSHTVRDIAQSCESLKTIRPETEAMRALAIMRTTGHSRLLVTDAEGKLVGIVTLRDLMKFISFKLNIEEDETLMPRQ